MSTKVAIIAEGSVDYVLLPALLQRIAIDRAQFTWPIEPDDLIELLPIRKRGHGGVLEKIRALVRLLQEMVLDFDCYVILLDRKTKPAQREIRRLITGHSLFVLGVAIEEIEAWWLADRTNTLAWSDLRAGPPEDCRYAASGYKAEHDDDPKRTLDELTRISDRFDRCYGQGNTDLATEFAIDYWEQFARLDEIASGCPEGFGAFEQDMTNALRAAKARTGRLF
jgi:hypothetical protein